MYVYIVQNYITNIHMLVQNLIFIGFVKNVLSIIFGAYINSKHVKGLKKINKKGKLVSNQVN